jgi:hypothetical protein
MKIKLTCDQCSNQYEVHPSTVKWNAIRGRKNKFCSRNCRTSFYSGSKNVFWGGGLNTKARHAFIEKQRRAAKRATGTHTQEQWETLKRLCNFTCLWCRRKEPEITLTEDHIEADICWRHKHH